MPEAQDIDKIVDMPSVIATKPAKLHIAKKTVTQKEPIIQGNIMEVAKPVDVTVASQRQVPSVQTVQRVVVPQRVEMLQKIVEMQVVKDRPASKDADGNQRHVPSVQQVQEEIYRPLLAHETAAGIKAARDKVADVPVVGLCKVPRAPSASFCEVLCEQAKFRRRLLAYPRFLEPSDAKALAISSKHLAVEIC